MAARSSSRPAQASSSRSVSARVSEPPMANDRLIPSTSSGATEDDVSERMFDISSVCAGVCDVSAT